MVLTSTTTLTWGTLAAAVGSAAMLVVVGCVMPDIRQQADDERASPDRATKAGRTDAGSSTTSARSGPVTRRHP